MKLLRGGGRNVEGRNGKAELGRENGSSDNAACLASCGPWADLILGSGGSSMRLFLHHVIDSAEPTKIP